MRKVFKKRKIVHTIIQQLNKKSNQNQNRRMIDRNLEKLKYETSVHHRQNLRNQIDQNMIDQIELSQTPSHNYQKAYKSLYHEELQKSVQLYDNKKNLENTKKNYGILVAGEHLNIFNNPNSQPFADSLAPKCTKNLNYRDVNYQDYDFLKEKKALDYTLKNYDGGQAFYKNSDLHQMNQRIEKENMRKTLLNQINQKIETKNMEGQKKNQQHYAIKNREQHQKGHHSQMSMQSLNQKIKQRDEILNQIQQQRIKRGRRSVFNYNSYTRHNPITNPIEYHIDNPYILKQIQNNKFNP